MENNPLRGLFGVSSPRPEKQLVSPQPTAPTENIGYEIPSGMIEQLLANTYATLLHHPFLFKGKPTQCSRGSSASLPCNGVRKEP